MTCTTCGGSGEVMLPVGSGPGEYPVEHHCDCVSECDARRLVRPTMLDFATWRLSRPDWRERLKAWQAR